MGRRTITSAAGLVLLAGLAAGCADAAPSDAEIDEWLESRPQTMADDAVGAMSSAIHPGPAAGEPAATLNLGQPADVTGLRVEGLGAENLLVSVAVTTADGEETLDRTFACADDPHEEELTVPGAQRVSVEAFTGDDHVGAVHIEVLGESITPG
ncbi:hypothetical protein AA0Y32_15305 [Georgenia phoenicis]|uniref:hypothetical protein n=1 Tax=unclassified Georgenia TaxID=2626815 RepID=UPI0039B0D42C